jgi:hypothetical protein
MKENSFHLSGRTFSYLDKGDISNDLAPNVFGANHVAEVGLGREARGKAHVEVSLQPKQRWHQNEQLGHFHEHRPMLWTHSAV